jgi:hypothetical protein
MSFYLVFGEKGNIPDPCLFETEDEASRYCKDHSSGDVVYYYQLAHVGQNLEEPKPFGQFVLEGKASTDGKGLWSNEVKKDIPIKIYFSEFHADAFFSLNDWDTYKVGLIYTDKTFLNDVRNLLKNAGLKHYQDIDFSEQGLQGVNYVDFDLGKKLYQELRKKFK